MKDAVVVRIRSALPKRPLSNDEAETLARKFKVHPMTIVNIAANRSYVRPKAYPKNHPQRIALNAEIAAKQRHRYKAHKHRQAVGDSQRWKCAYCDLDISSKGQAQLDHIVPVANGGTSDRENLQMLCRRCNARKSAHAPGPSLDAYMNRKIKLDRVFDKLTAILPPIVESLVWIDTCEAKCQSCNSETSMVSERYNFDPPVHKCMECRRLFRTTGWKDKSYFYTEVSDAVFERWYQSEEAAEIVRAVLEGDTKEAIQLIQQAAGELQELKKRRHSHKRPEGCWCEYGDDPYEIVQVCQQGELIVPMNVESAIQ